MGVERHTHLRGSTFDFGNESQEGPAVVRLGEAFAAHQTAALELVVGEQKPIGGHQLDSGRVVPAGE
ncbi:hypothetical protein VT69_02950 [Yersinia pestis]|nr:hypothetical protein VT69_02950 [Yersinia pestis]